jgi:molybdopterin synthase catalytic subunit
MMSNGMQIIGSTNLAINIKSYNFLKTNTPIWKRGKREGGIELRGENSEEQLKLKEDSERV